MATKKIDPKTVVWLPPELLDRAQGEYRVVEGWEVTNGTTVPVYGGQAVWVDHHPDDPENGAGHFEVYSGPDDEYVPIQKGES